MNVELLTLLLRIIEEITEVQMWMAEKPGRKMDEEGIGELSDLYCQLDKLGKWSDNFTWAHPADVVTEGTPTLPMETVLAERLSMLTKLLCKWARPELGGAENWHAEGGYGEDRLDKRVSWVLEDISQAIAWNYREDVLAIKEKTEEKINR